MPPSSLELLLTGAHSGLSLLFLALAWRQPRGDFRLAVLGVVLSGASLSLAQHLAPEAAAWRPWLLALAATAVYWFWAFCRLLFEDDFALQWRQAWLPLLAAGAVLARQADGLPGGFPLAWLPLLMSGLLGAHLLWTVWRERSGDLIEARRRLRWLFIALGAVLPPILVLLRRWADADAALAQATLLFLLKLSLCAYLMDLRLLPRPRRAAAVASVLADEGEAAVLSQLGRAMEAGAYRQSGLTIGALAARLGVPEYRLRRLINQQLDYRNFNDYLNDWRLREAARRLRDPDQARLPILSIALDVGFGSIGPFNRAFRQRYATTPSEFRRLKSDGRSAS